MSARGEMMKTMFKERGWPRSQVCAMRLREIAESTKLRFRTILSRSISAGLTHMVTTTLELSAATAQRKGANFQFSAIPAGYPKLATFDFRSTTMRPLFRYGYECAHAGRL